MRYILAVLAVLVTFTAHAVEVNDDALRRAENAWKTCDFAKAYNLGSWEKVKRNLDEVAHRVQYIPIADRHLEIVMRAYNAKPPQTHFLADRAFIVWSGATVYLQFVKNDCVYRVERTSVRGWLEFLGRVKALDPELEGLSRYSAPGNRS